MLAHSKLPLQRPTRFQLLVGAVLMCWLGVFAHSARAEEGLPPAGSYPQVIYSETMDPALQAQMNQSGTYDPDYCRCINWYCLDIPGTTQRECVCMVLLCDGPLSPKPF
jgi:hypothetical protein